MTWHRTKDGFDLVYVADEPKKRKARRKKKDDDG